MLNCPALLIGSDIICSAWSNHEITQNIYYWDNSIIQNIIIIYAKQTNMWENPMSDQLSLYAPVPTAAQPLSLLTTSEACPAS
jgi:hypothetical protein